MKTEHYKIGDSCYHVTHKEWGRGVIEIDHDNSPMLTVKFAKHPEGSVKVSFRELRRPPSLRPKKA
jgi:hypothetical protein